MGSNGIAKAAGGALSRTDGDIKYDICDPNNHRKQFVPSSVGCVENSQRNLLLANLSPDASSLLHRHLKEQEFSDRIALWDAGTPAARIFFPLSGLISIRMPTKDGPAIEVASIGREAAAGIPGGSTGVFPVLTQAVIQAPGRFMSISIQAFAACVNQNEEIRRVAGICRGWVLLQSQQIGACNSVHAVEARFCRWLLRASDALDDESVPVIQETIAQMLGVRRTTVTPIAQRFELRGVISCARGKIVIRDRVALQAAACDCHRTLGRANWPSELIRTKGADGIK
jgi:CRP-like cAMP-binding protein